MNKTVRMMLVALLFIAAAFTLSANGDGEGDMQAAASPEEMSGKIVVWSFTDEVGGMIPHFNDKYPNIEVEYVVIPNQDEVYLNKIINTMRSRATEPDVFTGERAYYQQLIDSGFWEPISDAPYNAEELVSDLAAYVPDLCRDKNGKINALSWQATPGGLFFNRDIAKDVLGTDDPEEVSKWTSDLDKFYELGEMIKDYYGGEKYLLSGYTDMSQFIFNLRKDPYVEGDTVTIPSSYVDYMKLGKEMRENGIERGVGAWSPAWFAGMADGSHFAYILPTWGLHYVMKPNAEPEANEGNAEWKGNWGLATPPASYSWGGTFIGINRFSEKKDLAWQFVKYVGYDPEFQEIWAKETGDFVANTKVVDKIKDDFSEPFLGGQNHYAYFYDEVEKIDASYTGPWDFQIENAWGDQVELYANGEKTMEQAFEDFKVAVKDFLPDATVVIEQ